MCRTETMERESGQRTIPVEEAVGLVLSHDITEIRPGEFKGPAFRKGHIVRPEDVCHLQRLGKERLYVLTIGEDELHEDQAAMALAAALAGPGVRIAGEPREGKVVLKADRDGLLAVNSEGLRSFNLLGDVMCATLHTNTLVTAGRTLAGTRVIPLVIPRRRVEDAIAIASVAAPMLEVRPLRRPRAGLVVTGTEVFSGRVRDAFAPVIRAKIAALGGEIAGVRYAPDDTGRIVEALEDLLASGADLLITTGGMSVDPDDVTRAAVRRLGAQDATYGAAVLPGAMFMVAYLPPRPDADGEPIPVVGVPACGIHHTTTVFDLMLPRILAGARIGRRELAELGHGGLCLDCPECRFPVCPFGK